MGSVMFDMGQLKDTRRDTRAVFPRAEARTCRVLSGELEVHAILAATV